MESQDYRRSASWRLAVTYNTGDSLRPMEPYVLLPENILRQFIDACAVYAEYRRVKADASRYSGGMYWKAQGPYEYLVRTTSDNRQIRLGPRTAATENDYNNFKSNKGAVETRLRHLRDAAKEAERVNKALRVGSVPPSVVNFLARLEDARVADVFITVGSAAMFAYEARAGVRISKAALSAGVTGRLDRTLNGIRVLVDEATSDDALLPILKLAEKSYRWKDAPCLVAVDERGFEVECLRRSNLHLNSSVAPRSKAGNLTSTRSSADDPVLADEKLEQIIVSSTGRMATMRALRPEIFIELNNSISGGIVTSGAEHSGHELLEARLVRRLIDDGLLETLEFPEHASRGEHT